MNCSVCSSVITVSIVINSSYCLCLFVKLAVHLLVAFVLLSLLFVVAAIWQIKMYINVLSCNCTLEQKHEGNGGKSR